MSLYEFEHEKLSHGKRVICGVDEAGRGPLAGPVYAAAVILDMEDEIDGLNDSKKLSALKRDRLYDEITHRALFWAVASRDNEVIDRINILQATMEAMKEAVESLGTEPDIVYVDGNRLPDISCPAEYVIHGDAISASIAAASIIAKVSRDRFMLEMDKKYPEYRFAQHKGYGTQLHYEMINKYGICEIHRRTFLKNIL